MMPTQVLLSLPLLLSVAHAFVPHLASPRSSVPSIGRLATTAPFLSSTSRPSLILSSKAKATDDETLYKNIQVTGNNIEVTPAMKDYVLKKIGKVVAKQHMEEAILKVDVHLSVVVVAHHAKHSHTAEATIFMKGGNVLRASETTDYLYASVDIISHSLTRLLRKYKERKLTQRKEMNYKDEALEMEAAAEMAASDDGLGFNDPADNINMKLVKTKSFPMPPLSVKDAIVCLSFISHPFYVFRNEETNEINVVYKRNNGGVGVIQPSN